MFGLACCVRKVVLSSFCIEWWEVGGGRCTHNFYSDVCAPICSLQRLHLNGNSQLGILKMDGTSSLQSPGYLGNFNPKERCHR